MGQDYKNNDYRKSYEREYVKTYPSYSNNRGLFEQQKKAYEKVSKKLNGTPYSKQEKGKSDDSLRQQPQTILPNGGYVGQSRKTTKPVSSTTSVETKSKPRVVSTPAPAPISVATPTPKPVSAPAAPVSQNTYKPQPQQADTDLSKIDKSALTHPIVSIGDGKYKNIYTQEIIGVDKARQILEYTGYVPKKHSIISLSFLILVVVSFFIKWVGVFILIVWGLTIMNKKTTNYIRTVSAGILTFPLPASPSEEQRYKMSAYLYIGAGVLLGIILLTFY